MTTTNLFQGMDPNAKNSSRVLAPPGGGSSNIFGTNEDTPSKRSNPNVNKGNNDIFGTGASPSPIATSTSPGKRHNPDNVNCGNSDIFHREQHAAASQPKSRAPRSDFNPITGETYQPKEESEEEKQKREEAEAAAAAEKQSQAAGSGIFGGHVPTPSTRVSQPPGGRSTKLW